MSVNRARARRRRRHKKQQRARAAELALAADTISRIIDPRVWAAEYISRSVRTATTGFVGMTATPAAQSIMTSTVIKTMEEFVATFGGFDDEAGMAK